MRTGVFQVPPQGVEGGVSGSVVLYDETTPRGSFTEVRFIGAGVNVYNSGTYAAVEVEGGVSPPVTGTVVVRDETTLRGSFPELRFIGDGVQVQNSGTYAAVGIGGGGVTTGTFNHSMPASAWYAADDTILPSARAQMKLGSQYTRFVEWLFHPALNEFLYIDIDVPMNFIDSPALKIDAKMASGTSGLVQWGLAHFCRRPSGPVQLNADAAAHQGISYGTGSAPGTAGVEFRATVNPTITGIQAGDRLELLLYRVATGSVDTANGDVEFVGANFVYSGY